MYNYAIIGFGGLGRVHLVNLLKLEKRRGDIKLKAICGTTPDKVNENIKINLGTADISRVDFTDVNFYDDYKDMVADGGIDFVVSVLPSYLHEEVAVYCLEHGIHVFAEKPMALTLEGCDNMIRAAEENDVKLMVGQCIRFESAYHTLKRYVYNERFGAVRSARFTRYSQTPMWTWKNWIIDPEKSGGAPLDLHIHDVDFINWCFGMPKKIRSYMTSKKVGAESIFTRYFYDGFSVNAEADWSMTSEFPFEARCIVNFEEATAVIEKDILTIYTDEDVIIPERNTKDHFLKEMEAFLKYVIDDIPCDITSAESVRESIRLALLEVESAKNDIEIEL